MGRAFGSPSVVRDNAGYAKNLSCWDQYLAMAFAQLTHRESLRDIETCLSAVGRKLYHMGFGSNVARSTLADANESRDWRIRPSTPKPISPKTSTN